MPPLWLTLHGLGFRVPGFRGLHHCVLQLHGELATYIKHKSGRGGRRRQSVACLAFGMATFNPKP